MATSEAAYLAEKVIGHGDNAITQQDVSDYSEIGGATTMKALVWRGKNKVEIGWWDLVHVPCGEYSR
jgi:hypothetical protein